MADLNHSFDHFAFTSEEKEQLTDRLRQAAEQEERMKEPTKRIIRHTGHRLLIGAGAAAALTMGALAATVGGGLLGYFEARTPEDQSALENGIYRLDRSESWNGWTVALTDCVGDNANSYVWVEVTAPEGTALGDAAALGYDSGYFDLDAKIKPEREDPAGSWGGRCWRWRTRSLATTACPSVSRWMFTPPSSWRAGSGTSPSVPFGMCGLPTRGRTKRSGMRTPS